MPQKFSIYTQINHFQQQQEPNDCQIIGSGPAGLYTAKHLLNDIENINIHVFEKNICPTGLIRYGMAPDHQKIKRVADELLSIKSHDNCHYFGGVQIGKDITIKEMEMMYSSIFYAFGAQNEKLLQIPGEKISMVYSAHEIVNWYNCHPDYYNLQINFENVKNLAIIGNGNVALDISRIFGLKKDELEKTDANQDTIEKLQKKCLQNVHQFFNQIIIVGRRGVVQSQFSLKELREMTKLPQFRFFLFKPDLLKSLNEQSETECRDLGINYGNVTRANRRKLEFMKNFEIIEDQETLSSILEAPQNQDGKINIIFRFLLSPVSIDKKLTLRLQHNQLKGNAFNQFSEKLEEFTDLQCNMIIKSVGYQSENIDNSIPWNNELDLIDNSDGCVKLDNQKLKVGQYACGWIKTGPKGVIDSTFASSQETIVNFKNHLDADLIQNKEDPYSQIKTLLYRKSVNFIDFEAWDKINKYEIQLGKQMNKPRVKLIHNNDFYKFISLK